MHLESGLLNHAIIFHMNINCQLRLPTDFDFLKITPSRLKIIQNFKGMCAHKFLNLGIRPKRFDSYVPLALYENTQAK